MSRLPLRFEGPKTLLRRFQNVSKCTLESKTLQIIFIGDMYGIAVFGGLRTSRSCLKQCGASFKVRAEHPGDISETVLALRGFKSHLSFSLGCHAFDFYDFNCFSHSACHGRPSRRLPGRVQHL